MTGLGIPNVGAPDLKDMEERKFPITNGAPRPTSCANAQHIIASDTACATEAAVLTGPIAPVRMNGITTIAWLWPEYTWIASDATLSTNCGELVLTFAITQKVPASAYAIIRSLPKRISTISTLS